MEDNSDGKVVLTISEGHFLKLVHENISLRKLNEEYLKMINLAIEYEYFPKKLKATIIKNIEQHKK